MKLKMDVVFVQTFANAWKTLKQKAELLSRAILIHQQRKNRFFFLMIKNK